MKVTSGLHLVHILHVSPWHGRLILLLKAEARPQPARPLGGLQGDCVMLANPNDENGLNGERKWMPFAFPAQYLPCQLAQKQKHQHKTVEGRSCV